jgi:hypothetical protein
MNFVVHEFHLIFFHYYFWSVIVFIKIIYILLLIWYFNLIIVLLYSLVLITIIYIIHFVSHHYLLIVQANLFSIFSDITNKNTMFLKFREPISYVSILEDLITLLCRYHKLALYLPSILNNHHKLHLHIHDNDVVWRLLWNFYGRPCNIFVFCSFISFLFRFLCYKYYHTW